MQGTRLGGYEILDKLGEGGMGEVWRARDPNLNRSVAIKLLASDVAADPGRRARFEQEARALGALNHPNIVSVYGAGSENGQFFLVSELIQGESLRALLDRGRIPLRKMIDLAVQIAEALAAAHAIGIVHRDLKPENIMVSQGGRIKVLDFGLAKQTLAAGEDSETVALSQAGMVVGTVGYMSPEQVRGEPVDARADVFSFGAVLYEMLTGRRAFEAGSAVETMNAILHAEPPEFETEGLSIPAALAAILRRCLEKSPAQRFQSAADLAFALRAAMPGSSSGIQTSAKLPAATRVRKWLWWGVAALTCAALFIIGYVSGSRAALQAPPRFQQISFRKGLITNARFTGDGRNVVYTAKWEGGPARTYLGTPGNPDARDLDLPEGGLLLDVASNDDIAFLVGPLLPDGTGTLDRSSISGGQMRPWLEGVALADWAPGTSSFAVLRRVNGRFRLEYPLGKILLDNLDWPLHAIRVSPDGNLVAYVHALSPSGLGLSVVDRSGKTRLLGVVSDQLPNLIDPSLSWTRDSREIWFRSFDPNEWGTLYSMDLKGRRRVITRLPGHITLYDIARDGRLLLRTDARQLGILGAAPGEPTERDLSCLDMSTLTGISDDGRVIAASVIGESGGPRGSVYLRKTDGSQPIRLGDGYAWAISPDGQWVSVFKPREGGARRFALLPVGPGEEQEISIPALKSGAVVFGWGRDGQTLFVHAQNERGAWRNYLWKSATGTLTAIGPEGVSGELPLVSPHRDQIATVGPGGRWRVYMVGSGESSLIEGITPHDIPRGWRSDNRSLYVLTHHDENKSLPVSILDTVTGVRTPWKDIRPGRPVEQLADLRVTPDGRAYAYNFIEKTSVLYVVTGLTSR